jgi:hypothetical protein
VSKDSSLSLSFIADVFCCSFCCSDDSHREVTVSPDVVCLHLNMLSFNPGGSPVKGKTADGKTADGKRMWTSKSWGDYLIARGKDLDGLPRVRGQDECEGENPSAQCHPDLITQKIQTAQDQPKFSRNLFNKDRSLQKETIWNIHSGTRLGNKQRAQHASLSPYIDLIARE